MRAQQKQSVNGRVSRPWSCQRFFNSHTRRSRAVTLHAANEIECPTCGIQKKKASLSPKNPNLLLVKLYQAKIIEPYVLLNAADEAYRTRL
jgi:hypothetical protein